MLTRHFSYKNVFEIVKKAITFSEKTQPAVRVMSWKSWFENQMVRRAILFGKLQKIWTVGRTSTTSNFVVFCFYAHDFYAVGLWK